MDYLYLAFFMGLFGSLHCVAMCGPLVMALPVSGKSTSAIMANRVIYQVGRVITYGLLGVIIAFLGTSITVKGWQQVLSITTGLILISIAVFTLLNHRFPGLERWKQHAFQPIIKKMGYWLYKPGGSFMAGIMNGLLPCGMVYMALAAALNADTVWKGGAFMIVFGSGTFPMMLAVSFFGSMIKKKFKFNLSKWLPSMYLILGIWFMLRGANLDIAYLSPLIYPEGAIFCD